MNMHHLVVLADLARAVEGLLGVDHENFVRGRQPGDCLLQRGQEDANDSASL